MMEHREELASEPTEQTTPPPPPADSVSFQSVRGIGPSIELALYNAGILTWEDALMAGVVELDRRVSGLGMARARVLFAAAQMNGD
jgi:predicted flap endonuclease-1-like 5' DNA nuclease